MALCLMGCKRRRNVFPSLLWHLSFAFLKWDTEMRKETQFHWQLLTRHLGENIHVQKSVAPLYFASADTSIVLVSILCCRRKMQAACLREFTSQTKEQISMAFMTSNLKTEKISFMQDTMDSMNFYSKKILKTPKQY